MSNEFSIRTANKNDLPALFELYLHLCDTEIMPITSDAMQLWESILADPNYHIIVGEQNGEIVSSVTLVIIKNLTRKMRPGAQIENIVTAPAYRNKGYAGLLLERAAKTAKEHNCYQMTLVSGAKNDSTVRLYINAGFANTEKSVFVMKL